MLRRFAPFRANLNLRRFGTNAEGVMAISTLILFVKLGDTGAYTIGRLFGTKMFNGRKLTPTLSPGKTWAGAFGAVTWAAVGGRARVGAVGAKS